MVCRQRIAIILNSLFPYRLSLYEKLYSHQEYDWMFFHGIKEKNDGRPAYRGGLTFPNQPVGYKEWKTGPFYIRWQGGVYQQVVKWHPDIVITQGIPSIITNWFVMDWANRRNIKTIIWHCGWESQSGNKRTLKIKQWLARRYLELADYTLVYSSKGARYLSTLLNQSENMRVCYNGLEIDHLIVKENEYRAKGKILREEYQLDGKKLFLYVGGMMAEKQIPLLLDAFQTIDSSERAVLWLVGDGPDLGKITNIIKSKQLKAVKLWGRINEDVDILFAAADYFVLPGTGGLALNQALFWRVPCVVSDADGTEDDLVIDGKTGFRFTANDHNSLENALINCLNLSEMKRSKLGDAGRAIVLERSNVDQMVQTFIETINLLVKS